MAEEVKKTGMSNGSQMRITDDERRLLQSIFKGNDPLLKLLRKMFLPEVDPDAPIGQLLDLWMTVSVKDKSPQDAYVELLARNTLISHLDQTLMQIKLLASMEEVTADEARAKMKANGNK